MEVHASETVPQGSENAPLNESANSIFCLGKCIYRTTWPDTHLNGRMDEFMVYDRALSLEEIQGIYDHQNTDAPATSGEADFNEGIRYVERLGDVSMGIYTNRP